MALIDSSLLDSNLLTLEADTENANKVKNTVLGRLLTDKIITEQQAKEYSENWQVIIIKVGWFEKWMKVFGRGRDKKTWIYKYVRFEDKEVPATSVTFTGDPMSTVTNT